MKKIYDKYDKRKIAQLPIVRFEGKIFEIFNEQESAAAVEKLLQQSILGVDTETRPSFTRGTLHRVAILQVATHTECYLFHLNLLGLSPSIVRFLEDTSVKKIGLSWHDDLLMLRRRGVFTPGYFVELQELVGAIGIQDRGLQKLYANLFGQRIIKREQLSNWELHSLTEKQRSYAATDAWACIMLYEELQRLEATHDYELEITEEEHDIQEPILEAQ